MDVGTDNIFGEVMEDDSDNRTCEEPNKCAYDPNILNLPNAWHKVVVYNNQCTKEQILNSLFELITEDEFCPVKYCEGSVGYDTFMVRMSSNALMVLFNNKLKLPVGNLILDLEIKLNLETFVAGDVMPITVLETSVKAIYNNSLRKGNSNVLDLDNLAKETASSDVIFNFSNRGNFRLLCNAIQKLHYSFKVVNTLSLCNNGIVHLQPLRAITGVNIKTMKLNGNNIKDLSSFKLLENFKLIALHVAGNPITNIDNYEQTIRSYLPSLFKLDSIEFYATDDSDKTGTDNIPNVDLGESWHQSNFEGKNNSYKVFEKYKKSMKWHQIKLVHNNNYTMRQLVSALFIATKNHNFYPCYYKREMGQDEFYVINAFDAIFELVKQNLVLMNPNTADKMAIITLVMNKGDYCPGQVIPIPHITKVMAECLDGETGELNLENAFDNIDMSLVAFDIANDKVLTDILENFSINHGTYCKALNLASNGIKSLVGLNALSRFSRIRRLDLRYNEIELREDFCSIPKNYQIQEIILHGNPLCGNISSSRDYVSLVLKHFPELTHIDTNPLLFRGYSLIRHQNYICDPTACLFLNSFIQEYFRFYDEMSRTPLLSLYHKNAIFSMSFNVNSSSALSKDRRISIYETKSRNIIHLYSLEKQEKNLIIGHAQIDRLFADLPNTRHILNSFQVDLTQFSHKIVMFTISGVFWENGICPLLHDPILLAFTRTFVLRKVPSDQGVYSRMNNYKIVNEQLHICQPTKSQEDVYAATTSEAPMPNESVYRQEDILALFMEFTRLKKEFCIKILSESKYVLKQAIQKFKLMQERDEIPFQCFEGNLVKQSQSRNLPVL